MEGLHGTAGYASHRCDVTLFACVIPVSPTQVVWGEVMKHEKLTFPTNPSEIPDIFFYIVDRDNR